MLYNACCVRTVVVSARTIAGATVGAVEARAGPTVGAGAAGVVGAALRTLSVALTASVSCTGSWRAGVEKILGVSTITMAVSSNASRVLRSILPNQGTGSKP